MEENGRKLALSLAGTGARRETEARTAALYAEVRHYEWRAEEEARELLARSREQTERKLARERERRLAQAARRVQEAKALAEQKVLSLVRERLDGELELLRSDAARYTKLLRLLVDETAEAVGKEGVLMASLRDVEAVSALTELTVEPNESVDGGVVGRTADGALWVINTLEARSERAMGLLLERFREIVLKS